MFVTMGAEATWRTTGEIPRAWEYLAHRQVNSFLPCMALIDIIGGYELSENEYFAPQIRRAVTLAASATICANDLYSAAKEAATEIGDFNLPLVLAAERNCSIEEAINISVDIYDSLVCSYEVAEAAALANASPQLRRFLAGARAWIGGSAAWHATSGRYQR